MNNTNALALLILVQVTSAAAITDMFGIGWGAVALFMPGLPQIYLLMVGMMTAQLLLTIPFFGLAAAAAYGAATDGSAITVGSKRAARTFHPEIPAECRTRNVHARHFHRGAHRRTASRATWREAG